MPSQLRDICFDCVSGRAVGEFWKVVLGGELSVRDDGVACLIPEGENLRYRFNPVSEPKTSKNRLHLDVNLPDAAEMERLRGAGATVIQEIRCDDGALWWTVMADVEGNEFCAFPPKES